MSMSDQYDVEDNLTEDSDESSVIKTLRKQQREQAAELKTLREQAEAAGAIAKENALFKANLGNLNDDQRQAILATAADSTPEAFLAKAQALGFVEPPAPAAPIEELEAHDRIATAATGGNTLDPAGYEAALRGCRNENEVAAVMAQFGKPGFYDSANSGNSNS